MKFKLSKTLYIKADDSKVKLDVDLIYPVGSIYMSVNSTSPATLFGGTWEQIKDTFLLGSGSYTLGATGGSETHTHKYGLTYIPYWHMLNDEPHILNYNSSGSYDEASPATLRGASTKFNSSMVTSATNVIAAVQIETANTSYVSNMPPYLVVNIWKRTA